MFIHCERVVEAQPKSVLGIHQCWCVFTPLFNRSRVKHDKHLFPLIKNIKAYIFEHIAMTKETANMVAIRIVYIGNK
jgi:hypothetical protein